MSYFDKIEQIQYEGTTSDNPLAFRYYNPDEIILGKEWKIICDLLPAIGITSAGMVRICLVLVRLIDLGRHREKH